MSGAQSINTERSTSSSVPPVESFQGNGGDLNLTLNRSQWLGISRALAIAAGESALRRNDDQMVVYTGLCANVTTRLGLNETAAMGGDRSPPITLAAGAGRS